MTELKQLPVGTFVIHRNFRKVKFSDKLKPLRIGPYKIIKHISDVTYELLSSDGSIFTTHRNHIMPYYPKEPSIFPHIKTYDNSTPHDDTNLSDNLNPDLESFSDDLCEDFHTTTESKLFSSHDPDHNLPFHHSDNDEPQISDSPIDVQQNSLYPNPFSSNYDINPEEQPITYPRVADTDHKYFDPSTPFETITDSESPPETPPDYPPDLIPGNRQTCTPYKLRSQPRKNYNESQMMKNCTTLFLLVY